MKFLLDTCMFIFKTDEGLEYAVTFTPLRNTGANLPILHLVTVTHCHDSDRSTIVGSRMTIHPPSDSVALLNLDEIMKCPTP